MKRFGTSCDWQNSIDHRSARVAAHAARTHRVRAVVQADAHLARAGRRHHFRGLVARGGGELHVVLAPFVSHARDRQAARVLHLRVERNGVALVRQALGVRPPCGGVRIVVEEILELRADERAAEVRVGHRRHHVGEQDEAARAAAARVGLVVVLHHHVSHLHAFEGVHRLVERAEDLPRRMAHEVLPDQSAGVREPVGEGRIGRQQKQARRFDRVRGEDDEPRVDAMLAPLRDRGTPRRSRGRVAAS